MKAPLLVAELGANHLGDFFRACDLVQAAAEAGADAVKLQAWQADTMAANKHVRIQSGPWAGSTLHDLYARCYTPWEWFSALKDVAEQHGIELFASAFDLPSVTFLEELGVRRHKVASFELVDDELVRACALTGKPLILSTGMATMDEIEHAVAEAEDMGAVGNITLLKCVSAYPSTPADANLRSLRYLRNAVDCDVGLSDHSTGNAVSVAATALGATIIERHFTLARSAGGPDADFSLEPAEFAELVADCRAAYDACAGTQIGPTAAEQHHLPLRRSLWWAADLPVGSMVMRHHVRSARPADGLPCSELNTLLGKRTTMAVQAGCPIHEGEFT